MHLGCDIKQVYLCRVPVDFRKSIAGLSMLVEQALELSPFGKRAVCPINRQRNDCIKDAKQDFVTYFKFCNHERPHSSLDDKTPDERYFDNLPVLPKAA